MFDTPGLLEAEVTPEVKLLRYCLGFSVTLHSCSETFNDAIGNPGIFPQK